MPRAPQSRALLAGRPLAKRRVFSARVSRTRSMPRRRLISTRLTFGTGREPAPGRLPDEGVGGGEIGRAAAGGAIRSSAAAMRGEEGQGLGGSEVAGIVGQGHAAQVAASGTA